MTLTSNTLRASLALTLVTGVVAASAQSAKAFSLTNMVPAGSTIINFEDYADSLPGEVNNYSSGIAEFSANPGAGLVVSGDDLDEPNPRYRAPLLGTTGKYLTVGSNGGPGTVETTINFSKPLDFFGLLWGSIDSYNEIQFFLDGSPVAGGLFTGNNVASFLGVSADVDAEGFVGFISSGSSQYFNQVVLRTLDTEIGISPIAFEVDNLTYREIPTPALLPGLIGMGVAAFRKRKQEATQAAEAET